MVEQSTDFPFSNISVQLLFHYINCINENISITKAFVKMNQSPFEQFRPRLWFLTLKSEQYTAVQNDSVNAPSGKQSAPYSFVIISDRIRLFVLLYQVWPTTRLDRLAIWYLDKSPQAAAAVLEFYYIDHCENRSLPSE